MASRTANWIRLPQEYNHSPFPNMFECTNCCKYTYEVTDYCPNCGKKRGEILDYKGSENGG